MKYTMNNIGPLSKINIDIEGISVIVGDNSAGKSLISKSLFYFLHLNKTFFEFENKTNFFGLKNETLTFDAGSYLEISHNDYSKFMSFIPPNIVEKGSATSIYPIYIDDSLIIKDLMHNIKSPHKELLKSELTHKCPRKFEKDKEIDELFASILDVDLIYEDGVFYTCTDNLKAKLDISKTPNGIQSYLVLKTLYSNGYLNEKTLLILDEPEIYFNSRWQLVYARLLVALVKKYNVKVLLNSVSIYFIEALEKLSLINKIKDKTFFYLAENTNKVTTLTNYSNEIDTIYEYLLEPFAELDNLLLDEEE